MKMNVVSPVMVQDNMTRLGSGPQLCTFLMSWFQFVFGAVGSIWSAYFLERTARRQFVRSAMATPSTGAAPALNEDEHVYYSMYSATSAWSSFLASSPAIMCISWFLMQWVSARYT